MSYLELLNRAYGLCMRCNAQAIVHDLAYMTESEILGVIYFLSSLQSS